MDPIDSSTATRPSWRSTWFVSLLKQQWSKTKGVPSEAEGGVDPKLESDSDSNTSDLSGESGSGNKSKVERKTGSSSSLVAGRRRNKTKKRS